MADLALPSPLISVSAVRTVKRAAKRRWNFSRSERLSSLAEERGTPLTPFPPFSLLWARPRCTNQPTNQPTTFLSFSPSVPLGTISGEDGYPAPPSLFVPGGPRPRPAGGRGLGRARGQARGKKGKGAEGAAAGAKEGGGLQAKRHLRPQAGKRCGYRIIKVVRGENNIWMFL